MRVKSSSTGPANKDFKKLGLRLAPKATKQKGNKPFTALRDVARTGKEWKYLDLVDMSEKKTVQFLREHKVYPVFFKHTAPIKEDEILCWDCSIAFKAKEQIVDCPLLRCDTPGCHQRRLNYSSYAFTPMYNAMAHGKEQHKKPSHNFFLRMTWLVVKHLQADQCYDLVRRECEPGREDRVLEFHRAVRIAIAWKEYTDMTCGTRCQNELLETDAGVSVVSIVTGKKAAAAAMKRPAATMHRPATTMKRPAGITDNKKFVKKAHKGRFAVTIGRRSRTWAVHPLKQKTTTEKGRATESVEDMLPVIRRACGPGTLTCADGSPAIKAALVQLGKARAPGACHVKHIYTPTVKVFRRDLSNDVIRMLEKEAATTSLGGRITVKAMRTCFVFVGGDNLAESLTEKIKSKRRRAGTLRNATDTMQNVENLHAAALLRNPTLQMALDAIAGYRAFLSKAAWCSPADAFSNETIDRWLK